MGKIKLLIKYFLHKLVSKGAKGHGIHSPFVFKFNRNVLNNNNNYPEYCAIMNFRSSLIRNRNIITVKDYGAGSLVFSSDKRMTGDIARYTASSYKTGKLLFRLVRYFNPDIILELGTSLGFGTFCLAKGVEDSGGKIYSLEACPQQYSIASIELGKAGIGNVELINAHFKDKLPELLNKIEKVDFVYFDGDHRKEAVLWQFRQCHAKAHSGTLFVVGDIHWSAEMEEAWRILCCDSSVTLSLDLFYCGLLFFRKDMAKQKYKLEYSG